MVAIGIDIEEVSRFQSLARNARFMERVYTAKERAYCDSKKKKLQHYAARFAAKEAVWKALSSRLEKMKKVLGHRDIGVRNDSSGKPHVTLPKSFSALEKKISLSLSHTRTTVVAVAVFQG